MITQGMIIGERYKIIKLIGDGGMARVYLANDMILNRNVAIKILRHELADDSTFIKRFEREARAVTSLSHPNIVGIYDIGSDNGNYYIVMEYIEGKTLKHLIKERGTLNVTETLALMKQITNGVSHAHSHGIIHRDLKPQNILLKRDGTVKITDFGIALTNSATSITKTNSIMGSVHYLAPEIARGESASVQSDIYALGIIMYEMLTGELPYKDSAPVAIVMKHMRDPFPSVRDFDASIPQSIENTIILATAKSKRNRLRTARELYAALSSALNSRRMNEQRIVFTGSDRSEQYALSDAKAGQKKNPQPENAKKSKPKLRVDRLLALLLVLVGTITIVVIGFFFALSGNSKPKTTIVPNVTSKTVDEAKIALDNNKLKVDSSIEYVYSDTVEKDKVVSTNPQAQEAVTEGTTVKLSVSKGVNYKMDYSQIIGKPIDEVEKLLRDNNVKYKVDEKYDNQPAGTVIAVSVPDKTEVGDQEITVTKSKGVEQTTVPDFTGMTYKEAVKAAADAKLKIKYYEVSGNSVDAGKVVSQNIDSNKSVNIDTTITVAVSTGAPKNTNTNPSNGSGNNGSGSTSGNNGSTSGSGSTSGNNGSGSTTGNGSTSSSGSTTNSGNNSGSTSSGNE